MAVPLGWLIVSNRLLSLAKAIPLKGGKKSVLLVLADTADDEGVCWQGATTLAQWTGMGNSTVWRHLAALEELGLVARRRRRNTSSVLQLDETAMKALREVDPDAVVITLRPGENSRFENSQSENSRIGNPELSIRQVAYKDEPSLNPHSSTSTTSTRQTKRDRDAAFDRFWSVYPRRVAKQDAVKAFAKALKAATVEQIVAGVEAYVADCRKAGRERDHIAHPASWLNAGRWEDEYAGMAPTDPLAWLRDEYRAGRVTEIHRFYASGYVQPAAGDGDYLNDVLLPYNRQWITEHRDRIVARLSQEAS